MLKKLAISINLIVVFVLWLPNFFKNNESLERKCRFASAVLLTLGAIIAVINY